MRILVVEDDENKRSQVVAYLSSAYRSAEIVERRSYQSGLKEIFEGRYDVALIGCSSNADSVGLGR
jgi:DNA-binding response OmpR family regulator